MSNPRWTQIQELFIQALELPPGERAAFLDGACDVPDVRAEVEAMLAGEESPNELRVLERLPLAQRSARGPLTRGERVGRYEIIEQVGTGGMGEVYRAERVDDQYRQQVAIKVLRGDLAVPALAARFRTERQILATLQHPHVTTLLDGGATEDGRPYLVMQFEAGLPVTTYADEHGLTIRRRLELFATICDAVQYAHTNLVVHRDIKPSNVVVDDEGRPKLLDFGIAKLLENAALESAPQTRDVQMLTPEYAAPEQITGGAITTSTDVYALGILLYELLVGEPPFRAGAGSPLEFHRRVCEEPPTRPSDGVLAFTRRPPSDQATDIATLRGVGPARLYHALRGDLDQIVLTALRKEPERRYPSAGALAEDIRRYLDGLPVWAQPDSRRYRTRMFVRRHRWGVGASAGFVVLLGAFAALMTLQSARVTAERDRAQVALARAEEVQEFLVGLFQASDPTQEQDRLSAADLLRRGAERADSLADQPEVYAEMLTTIGSAYRNLGQFPEADSLLRHALDLRRELYGDASADVAKTQGQLALLRFGQGDYDGAQREYEALRDLYTALEGPRSSKAIASVLSLGATRAARGELNESLPFFEEVIAAYDGVAPEDLEKADRENYSGALNNLGLALVRLNELERAEPYLQQALDINRALLGDAHPTIATNLNNLSTLYFRQGRYEEAETLLQDVLRRRRALYGSDHPDVGAPLNNLAQVMSRLGRYEEAEAYAQEAIALQRRLQGPEHPLLGLGLKNLSRLLIRREKLREAEEAALESLRIFRTAFGDDHSQTQDVRSVLVEIYTALGQPERAASYR